MQVLDDLGAAGAESLGVCLGGVLPAARTLRAGGVIDLMTLLVKTGLCTTKSDARRNIQQGGVTVDDEKVTDTGKTYTADELKAGLILRRGKKNFNKVILK